MRRPPAPSTASVNPSLSIAPGETQLWRLANIGADIWYEVSLEGHPFHVVGEDANPVWQTWSAESLVLPPGKRFDVLVQGASAGTYILRTLDYDQGGDHYPDTTLATLTVEGTPSRRPTLPTSLMPRTTPPTATSPRGRSTRSGRWSSPRTTTPTPS